MSILATSVETAALFGSERIFSPADMIICNSTPTTVDSMLLSSCNNVCTSTACSSLTSCPRMYLMELNLLPTDCCKCRGTYAGSNVPRAQSNCVSNETNHCRALNSRTLGRASQYCCTLQAQCRFGFQGN